MTKRSGTIYGLYCVCDNCKDRREWIRYVGQTIISNPVRRLNQHRFESRSEAAYLAVHLWMRKHGDQNIRMKYLESGVPEETLNDRETFWISEKKTFRDAGFGGLNLTRDGLGSEITDKSRKRQRNSLRRTRARHRDERIVQNFPGLTAKGVVNQVRQRYLTDPMYGFKEIARDLSISDIKLARRIIRNEEYIDPGYVPPTQENEPSMKYRYENGLLSPSGAEKWETVVKIREDWLRGDMTSFEVGDKYGLNHQTVWHIVNNRSYYDPEYQNTRGRAVTDSVKKRISTQLTGVKKPDGFGRKGEDNVTSKLTQRSVEEILDKLSKGAKGRDLSMDYGVTEATISKIKCGQVWKHITRPEELK